MVIARKYLQTRWSASADIHMTASVLISISGVGSHHLSHSVPDLPVQGFSKRQVLLLGRYLGNGNNLNDLINSRSCSFGHRLTNLLEGHNLDTGACSFGVVSNNTRNPTSAMISQSKVFN